MRKEIEEKCSNTISNKMTFMHRLTDLTTSHKKDTMICTVLQEEEATVKVELLMARVE